MWTRTERTPQRARPSTERGFTLIELMSVVAIIGILIGVALPNYKTSIIRAKEAVLREDLYRFRSAIDQYHADKGEYPASLDALVKEDYLRDIPVDPITQQRNWVEEPYQDDDTGSSGGTSTPGIFDVRSASEATSLSGTPYSEW